MLAGSLAGCFFRHHGCLKRYCLSASAAVNKDAVKKLFR
jgi:hypothetical protein